MPFNVVFNLTWNTACLANEIEWHIDNTIPSMKKLAETKISNPAILNS